jgi:fatty acid desaturase
MHSNPHTNEYAELKRLLTQQGLFAGQPVYYTYKVIQTLSFFALALAIITTMDFFWLQMLNAAFLAFAFTQMAFMGHDAGHRQMFQSSHKADIFGLFCSLLTGVSYSWWIEKHNQHHKHPNHLERDPDVQLRFLTFATEQTSMAHEFRQSIVKYQAYLFFPMLLLQGFAIRIKSIRFLLSERARFPIVEQLFMAAHVSVYLGFICAFLPMWQALIFILVHQMLFGLYMGCVFAPNHKGMLMLQDHCTVDQLRRQILTARNVKSHPLTDFWFGGLNYQVEHHLFPSMARNKLKEAQATVKAFCQAHAIAYCETSIWQAYREILRYLHHVSAPLRQSDRDKPTKHQGSRLEPKRSQQAQ